jgi:aminoglycoside phosphotransferase (APT) family kinase protein
MNKPAKSPASEAILPLDRLTIWLNENVRGFRGLLRVQRFAGGQSNPTFKLEAVSGDSRAVAACLRSSRFSGTALLRLRAIRGRGC